MIFYLGTHMPHWLGILDVPLFVSHRRLAGRRTLPVARGPWALDSGGFSELSMFGQWRTSPTQYVAAVQRYADEIGQLAWAAPQDHMCEPIMLAKTGKTVGEHQRLTVENYVRLRSMAPQLPFVPVLQGWRLDDYRRCADAYARAGIDLTAEPTVGIGSVCRRQATGEIDAIVSTLAADGLRLHGFGVKTKGLAAYAPSLTSADSMAWSVDGRRTAGCAHGRPALNEANCRSFALAWRERVLATVAAPSQPALFTMAVAA